MKIWEIVDPTYQEYKVKKGELERLRASDPLSRWVDYMKGHYNRGIEDEPAYQRKKAYYDKLRKVHHQRWYDMTKNVDYLKGNVAYNKYKHLPTGMFVAYDATPGVESPEYFDDIGRLIDRQNETLEYPAADVIDRFVGHPHMRKGVNSDWGAGGWNERNLEDAYSSNPSEQGILVRQQLEAAMVPIRDAIRARYGDQLVLYRSQRTLTGSENPRNVLSWTASQKFSNYHGGDDFQKIEATINVADIVWVTDRANQQEFIILNHQNAPHYIPVG